MNKTINLVLTTLLLLSMFSCNCAKKLNYNTKQVIQLDKGWYFKKEGEQKWLPASVPGCVYTDLLNNNKIAEPFYRNNEKSLQWIDTCNWVYCCIFNIDSSELNSKQVLLKLHGMDTYAKVILNKKVILETDNMYRTWCIDVKPYLTPGENIIEITLYSAVNIGLEKLEKLGYPLPAVNDQSQVGGLGDKRVSVFSRKAPYHFGWDWGPRFVTAGIWRPVELIFAQNAILEDVFFKQKTVNEKTASIETILEIEAAVAGNYQVQITTDDRKISIPSAAFDLKEGKNIVSLPFQVNNPKLWWPNGMGEQHLYTFKTLLIKDNIVVDTLSDKIGIRSVKLVRTPDKKGATFHFEVNGKPFFAKGANYIPNDNFLTRVTSDKYEYIIKSAVEANMNMLRVWGGGIYENDVFYDLCDKYGIMLWQDFMYACSMYPGDDAFLESARLEAIDNVKRIRNHASLAMYCGNNEMDIAWCQDIPDCGWRLKERYNPEQRQQIWHAYDTLFHKILPAVISEYDDLHAYWPSSPLADIGKHAGYDTPSGDMHYWGVWHGREPFSTYYKVIGRFMSEYGFQSFPSFESIRKFTIPADWDLHSEVMLSHQRSGNGNDLMVDYLKALYSVPSQFEDLLYVSQVMQAEAIKQAIDAHRANKPYCMGTLYWQLNDCWPAASWSSIDYYGQWKALHYYAKRGFAPVTLSFMPDSNALKIYVNNDSKENNDAVLTWTILDFAGKNLKEEKVQTQINTEKSIEACVIPVKDLGEKYDLKNVFLHAVLQVGKKEITSEVYFFEAPKDLNLPEANLEVTVKKGKNPTITLSADKLAMNVFLSTPGIDSHFSDNYFHLLPGTSKTISCTLENKATLRKEDLKIKTLNDLKK